MKRFSEQLQKKADAVRLSAGDKRDLRDRVVSYMEYHPLPLSLKEASTLHQKSIVTPVRLVHVNGWRLFQSIGAALGVLLLTITYAAEQAVPGDSLYAVKVRFNEEVRGTLVRGSYEKVVWETERLNRRIAEARLLASEGRLTAEVEAGVAEAVREHSDNARREIEILKQTDKDEAALASIQLETTLEVQTTAINKEEHLSEDLDPEADLSPIATALRDSQGEVHEVTEQEAEDALPAYVRLTAHVEQETTRAYELLKSVKKSATPEERADIERRLEDIARSIDEASMKAEANDVEARQGLVAVLQRTQKLIVFMTNIDIRSTVTVEEIVPVALTLEERNANLKKTAETMSLELATIELALAASSTAPELVEKIAPAIVTSKAVASTTLLSFPYTEEGIDSAEAQLSAAKAVVTDAMTALGLEVGLVKEVITPVPAEVLQVEPEADPVSEATTTVSTSTEETLPIETVIDPVEQILPDAV